MFFVLSKVFWLLVQPLSVVLLLVVAGLVLGLFGRRRLAAAAQVAAIMVVGLFGYTSLGAMLISPLEERFAQPETPPSDVNAIVMLGGATDSHVSASRSTVAMDDAGERLTTALWLAGRYPDAKIVLSGGGGAGDEGGESEAETAQRFFVEQGVSPDRLVLEGHSRNTIENAAFTRDLVSPKGAETVLVTSAFHMPRSVGLFRAQGIDVVPWPTDYRSRAGQGFSLELSTPLKNFDTASTAIREWVGLLVYRLTGQIGDIFPAP